MKYGRLQDLLQVEVENSVVYSAQGAAAVLEAFPRDTSYQREEVYARMERSFHNFLIGLDNPIQIYMRTVRYSVDNYLNYLDRLNDNQIHRDNSNIGLLELGHEFRNYIAEANSGESYYRVHYYIVIWALDLSLRSLVPQMSFLSKLPLLGALFGGAQVAQESSRHDPERAQALRDRAAQVSASLAQSELKCRLLGDDELLQLFNSALNPAELGGNSIVSRDHLGRLTLAERA